MKDEQINDDDIVVFNCQKSTSFNVFTVVPNIAYIM
jgi:hypothetical protein